MYQNLTSTFSTAQATLKCMKNKIIIANNGSRKSLIAM